MAQSKVKHVKGNGDWPNKFGETMYSFEYELEDGVIGLANHKTLQPKFNPGDSVEYIKGTDKIGNTTIKFVEQKPFSSGSGKSNSSFALSYAKDLVVSGHAKIEDILKYADKLNKWLNQN